MATRLVQEDGLWKVCWLNGYLSQRNPIPGRLVVKGFRKPRKGGDVPGVLRFSEAPILVGQSMRLWRHVDNVTCWKQFEYFCGQYIQQDPNQQC